MNNFLILSKQTVICLLTYHNTCYNMCYHFQLLMFQDIADQRLIYAGHLLDDVQLLTDVFGLNGATNSFQTQSSYQHSGPYTIHLACTSKSYVSPSQRSTR